MSDAKTQTKPKDKNSKPQKAKRPPKPVGLATLVVFSGLAAILGAIGGYGLSSVLKTETTSIDLTSVEGEIANLEKTQALLEARINRLDATQKSLTEVNQSPSKALSDIENRIQALESGVAIENSGLDLTNFQTRLEGMELQISELPQTGPNTGQEIDIPSVDLSPLEQRVALLERQLGELQNAGREDRSEFPKDAVIASLSSEDTEPSKNWFKRAIDSQITVRDDTHLKTVDEITILIDKGDIKGAIKLIETLPISAQTAAEDWVEAVTD